MTRVLRVLSGYRHEVQIYPRRPIVSPWVLIATACLAAACHFLILGAGQ